MFRHLMIFTGLLFFSVCCNSDRSMASTFDSGRRPIPHEHPRLLGSAEYLKQLARNRPEAYTRMSEVVTQREGGKHERMVSCALVYVIDGAENWGREAVDLAMEYIEAPILVGHTRFGDILANCAVVYDLCRPLWTQEQREKFYDYIDRTVDANVNSEVAVFHNAWYSYKHWGYGLAAYATYYEYDRAREIHDSLEKEYLERVVPSFRMAGKGGAWAEGYYVHYWSYEWMFFCEAARRVEVSPNSPAKQDFFIHVLTAAGSEENNVPKAIASEEGNELKVTIGDKVVVFRKDRVAGRILVNGSEIPLADRIIE
jgi:hypothetical protein